VGKPVRALLEKDYSCLHTLPRDSNSVGPTFEELAC